MLTRLLTLSGKSNRFLSPSYLLPSEITFKESRRRVPRARDDTWLSPSVPRGDPRHSSSTVLLRPFLKNFRFNLFPEAGGSVTPTTTSAAPGEHQEEQLPGCYQGLPSCSRMGCCCCTDEPSSKVEPGVRIILYDYDRARNVRPFRRETLLVFFWPRRRKRRKEKPGDWDRVAGLPRKFRR